METYVQNVLNRRFKSKNTFIPLITHENSLQTSVVFKFSSPGCFIVCYVPVVFMFLKSKNMVVSQAKEEEPVKFKRKPSIQLV